MYISLRRTIISSFSQIKTMLTVIYTHLDDIITQELTQQDHVQYALFSSYLFSNSQLE